MVKIDRNRVQKLWLEVLASEESYGIDAKMKSIALNSAILTGFLPSEQLRPADLLL